MNVIEAIRSKRAVRRYRDEPLPEAVVRTILHAGRRAQSSQNDQAWHFIAIRDRALLEALAATSSNVRHIAGAALTVAIVTPPTEDKPSILFDAGQAAANMQLAAWDQGVVSCLATLFQAEEARRLLGVPRERHLRFAIAFGYPLSDDAAPRPGRRGGRRNLEDVVNWDRW